MEDDPKKIASALSNIYPQIKCVLFDGGASVGVGVMRRFLECIEVLPGHENGIIRITKMTGVVAGDAVGKEVRLVVLSTLHAGNNIVLTRESADEIDRLKDDAAEKAEIMYARSPARPGPVVFTLHVDRRSHRVQVPENVKYLQHNLPCNEFQVANDFLRSLGQRITGGDGPSPGMTSDEWVAGFADRIMEVEEAHRVETARVHNRFYEKKEDRARGLTERAHAQFKLDGGLCATVAEDRQNQVFYKWGLGEFVQPGRVFFTSSTDHDEWSSTGAPDPEVSSVAFNLVFGVEFRTRVVFGVESFMCCYTRSFYVDMNKFRRAFGGRSSLMFLCTDLLKLLSGKQLYHHLVKLSTPTKSDEFDELISRGLDPVMPRCSKLEYDEDKLFDLLKGSLGFRHDFVANFKTVDPRMLFIDAGCGELQVLTPHEGRGGGGGGGGEYSVSPMRLVSANDDAVQIIDSDGTLTVRITGLGHRELVSLQALIHPSSPNADLFGSDASNYGSSEDEGGRGASWDGGGGGGGRKKRKYTRNKRRISVKRIRSVKNRLCSHRRRRSGVRRRRQRRNTIKKLK